MEWKPGGISDDVEDRRGDGGGGGFGGYGPHLGIGGTLLLLVLSLVFHRNLFLLFSGGEAPVDRPAYSAPDNAAQDTEVQFVSFVLDDVQGTWQNLLPAQGVTGNTAMPSWCCSAIRLTRRAGRRRAQRAVLLSGR